METDEIPPGELYTYTDGSVKTPQGTGKVLGSYGWIIPLPEIQSEEDILYAGGGREVMSKNVIEYANKGHETHLPDGQKMSSTRMEAMAILPLHIYRYTLRSPS
jgi:hypothetical protein